MKLLRALSTALLTLASVATTQLQAKCPCQNGGKKSVLVIAAPSLDIDAIKDVLHQLTQNSWLEDQEELSPELIQHANNVHANIVSHALPSTETLDMLMRHDIPVVYVAQEDEEETAYTAWSEHPKVYVAKIEKLVGAQDSKSWDEQVKEIHQLAGHIDHKVSWKKAALIATKVGTYTKTQNDDWKLKAEQQEEDDEEELYNELYSKALKTVPLSVQEELAAYLAE